jgi:phage/plasmid-like protein (TIGR03299 family)
MPHEIESIAFAGQTPWHGLGTPLTEDDLYDWPRVREKSGLNWQVELTPLVTADTQAAVAHRAVRRTADGKVLGVVGPRFTVLQNKDAFSWFTPFLEAREAALHTAGSLRGGSRVWVLAKIERSPLVVAPGDEVEKYLLLSHGHDGSLAVRVGFTPIRVVCANTLALAHGNDASKLIRLKHTKDVLENLENVRTIMDAANAAFEATAEQFRLLARRSINQADLRKYVKRVLKVEDKEDISTRTTNVIERIIGLFETGRGNDLPSIRGSYWAAYNSVSEFLGYERGRSPQTRLDSLWFGDSARINRHALQIALEMAA